MRRKTKKNDKRSKKIGKKAKKYDKGQGTQYSDDSDRKSYGKKVIKIPAIEKKSTGRKNNKVIVPPRVFSTPKSVGFPTISRNGRADSVGIRSPKKKIILSARE